MRQRTVVLEVPLSECLTDACQSVIYPFFRIVGERRRASFLVNDAVLIKYFYIVTRR